MASGDTILSIQNFRVTRELEEDGRTQADLTAVASGTAGAAKAQIDVNNELVGWSLAEGSLQFGKNYTITITEQ